MHNKCMKAAFIETLGDGGIAHYTYSLTNALRSHSCTPILITTYTYEFSDVTHVKSFPCFFKLTFCLINRYPSLSMETRCFTFLRRLIKLIEFPFNTFKCLRVLKSEHPDVVHFQTIHLLEMLLLYLVRLSGFTTVYTVHNVNPGHSRPSAFVRKIYSFFYRNCNCLIIHSKKSMDDFSRIFRLIKPNIWVIPHGDYSMFRPAELLTKDSARTSLGVPEDCPTILFFGAIRVNKGLKDLLYALQLIRKRMTNIVLMIVGESFSDYREYTDLMRILNIEDSVYQRLGYIPSSDIHLYFTAADIVALPYLEISQSGVLHIAYAFGKPVIATSIGAFPETVEDGVNGFLVPPGEPEAIADRAFELLSNRKAIESMGAASLELCNKRYSWDSIAQRTLALYHQITVNDVEIRDVSN